jgi:Ner family transcriptional regulator
MYSSNENIIIISETKMTSAEIQFNLKKLGHTQAKLALELKVSPAVVSNTILNRVTSWTVAQHIATLLGKKPEELWPDRYCFKPRQARRAAANPGNES